ncbi:HAD family acid phosphatase [Planctomycetota bacterium]
MRAPAAVTGSLAPLVRTLLVVALSGLALTACKSSGTGSVPVSVPAGGHAPGSAAANSGSASGGAGCVNCVGAAFQAPPAQGFRHTLMGFLASAAAPQHSAQDVILPPGTQAQLPGKFAYGLVSKDLEDEDVRVYLYDCQAWRLVNQVTTNNDGRTTAPLDPASLGLGLGVYDLRQAVLGDASVTPSQLRIFPAATKLVVFDIDGTLTTSDTELLHDAVNDFFRPLFNRSFVPQAYDAAVDLTNAYAAKGYVLIYLTGRPYWLTRITREWLRDLGFAPGGLHVADSNSQVLPSKSSVGDYKKDYLNHLQSLGYEIVYAYGNATTDIYAYREAGIPLVQTFTIGSHAGEGGTNPIHGGYRTHLATVMALPPANQPF